VILFVGQGGCDVIEPILSGHVQELLGVGCGGVNDI
jgi:hypothetical protein